MVNDPIGDMIIQIKNAGMVGKPIISLPSSKGKFAVASILLKEGYVRSVEQKGEAPRLQLVIKLKYVNGKHVITDVKSMSKPGIRLYVDKNTIPVILGGMGTAIISTSKGVMTGKEAKKTGIGGELMCEIW